VRRTTQTVLASWLTAAAWLGCNAILGNESATFVPPDAGTAESGSATPPAPPPPPVDGAAVDAGACEGVDLTASGTNCGVCGHDCLGGGCVGGRCQPFVVAADTDGLIAVALDDAYVYWNNTVTGHVMRAPLTLDAGPPEILYDGVAGDTPGDTVAVYGAHVYFTRPDADGGVVRCPKTGCADAGPELVVANLDYPRFVAVLDGGVVVFTESTNPGRVGRCAQPCASPEVLGSDPFPRFVAIDGDEAYWSTLGSGIRANIGAGGSTVTIASVGFSSEVALAGPDVVFALSGGGVRAVPRDGGSVRKLYEPTTQTTRLAVDGPYVYFGDTLSANGAVLRCPLDGGCGDAGVNVATNQFLPRGIAVDAKSIVWANQGSSPNGGTIMRLAK
jgi:hypothetical protein